MIFVLATLFSQLTMLNMLIAIMGDTYSRITENKDLWATKTKLGLLADYAANIRSDPTQDDLDKKFMFVVEPENEEMAGSWQGSVSQITTLIKKHTNSLQAKTVRKFDFLEEQVAEVSSDVAALDVKMAGHAVNMNEKVTTIKTEVGDLKEGVENLDRKFEEVKSMLEKVLTQTQ